MSDTTRTDDSIVTDTDGNTVWPTSATGDGSHENDWDETSFSAFAEVFGQRLGTILEDVSLDITTGPAAIKALISEAHEGTNIPVNVLNALVNQIINPDPLAALLAQLGLDPNSVLGG
jgi:hypothetical protein